MAERALPDLKTRVTVNTAQLTAAEAKVARFGPNVKAHMATGAGGIKNFEKAAADSTRVLGEHGRSMEGLSSKVTALSGVGGYGTLGLEVLALTAGVGALAEGLRSAVELSEAQEGALKGLEQAVAVTGGNYDKAKAQVMGFIDANRRYIPNQAQVIAGTAKLTREGLNQYQLQRDQNIALDLAATKNITYSEAVDIVAKAEAGRLRGLADLGIKTTGLTDKTANAVTKGKALSKILDEVAAKEKGGRNTLTELAQAQNELGNDWTDLATTIGPPVIGLLDGIVQGADWVLRKLRELGNNKDWNRNVAAAFGYWQDLLLGVISDVQTLIGWLQAAGRLLGNINGPRGQGGGLNLGNVLHRQFGGSVVPGRVYDVGEAGPERLVMMPGGGGYVVPNPAAAGPVVGGATSVQVFVESNASAADIAAELGWELRKLRRFG